MPGDILSLELGEFDSNFCPGGWEVHAFCLDVLLIPFTRPGGRGGWGFLVHEHALHTLYTSRQV